MDTYGGFASDQITLRLDSPEAVSAVMAEIRSQRPVVAASLQARTVDDFVDGLGDFPPANMLRFSTVDDGRIIIRPSGTEPKLKVYVDALASSHSDATALVRSLRQRVMGALEPFGVAADAR
jgi:phosphomannomutase